MGEFTGNSDWVSVLLRLAEINMLARIVAYFIIGLVGMTIIGWSINRIGIEWVGRSDLLPSFYKGILRLFTRLTPILRSKLQRYRNEVKQPKPPTRSQRIATGIVMILFMLAFGFLMVSLVSNQSINAYTTSRGGILVEVQANRQPTDGFQFDIKFDRPAKVVGVWTDVPSYLNKSKQFNIRTEQSVNFKEFVQGTESTISADYPIATPQKSVFVYFQPTDNITEQLKTILVENRGK